MKRKEVFKNVSSLITDVHSLWTEQYRPTELKELAVDTDVKLFIEKSIETSDFPNLLLFGKPGTGKNSIVNVMINNIDCIKLIINASEERGIDTIRDKVQSFALSGAWGNVIKIIVLNEADGLNYTAQDSLRELMETSSKYCRFIFTCNSINRINSAIRSRCVEFEISPDMVDIAKRLVEILDVEDVEYEDDYIVAIIKKYGHDFRKIINESQKLSSISDKLTAEAVVNNIDERYNIFFKEILSKNNSVKEVAKLVNKMIFDDDIYVALKDFVIEEYENSDAIIIIADHAYKSRVIFDKDLVFMSCIFNLRDILN